MNTGISTRVMLVILSGLCFMLGIRLTLTENAHPMDWILLWVIDIMMIYLCVRDARREGRGILNIFRAIMFFTWPISIAVYWVWFRGWKGLLLVLLWGTVFLVLCSAGGFLAEYIIMRF